MSNRRMDRYEMRNFWEARRRDGDISRVAERTGFSRSHVGNMVNDRRRLDENVARELRRISRNRTTNSVLRSRYPNVNVETEFGNYRSR